MGSRLVTLALCGDVMLGRGVDQILAHPGDPALREGWVQDAREYVALAEAVNGPVPLPVDDAWPWGDALTALDEAAPDARVLNLETSITRSDDFAPGKPVCYRMSPNNVGALAVVRPDVCVLANNHVLDFGRRGLEETLEVLAGAGLRAAGAGRDADDAARPAVVDLARGGRLLVFAIGTLSSGVPAAWAAGRDLPGVNLLPYVSDRHAAAVAARLRAAKRPGDIAVVSIHWGPNWGYGIPKDERRFAHALVDAGADVVHGHSSHHPRPLEVYRGRPILFGCGDFVNDYEGISGFEEYRGELRLLYLASMDAATGDLAGVRIVPFRARQMALRRASRPDVEWTRATLDRVSRGLGTRIEASEGGTLLVRAA